MSMNSADYQIDADVMHEFITGSEEHIAEAENALIDLEKRPDSAELINEIFRHFHSLKGDAASIGADTVRDLAHELESLLDQLREQQLAVTPTLLDLLLEGLSAVEAQIRAIAAGKAAPPALELIAKLNGYRPERVGEAVAAPGTAAESLAERFAAQETADDEGHEPAERTYITFRTGTISCAINVNQSNEIIGKPHITPVPNVEGYIEGVINLRGSIVPVINLARRLNIAAQPSAAPQILILIADGLKLGLLVDEVLGVRSWADSRLLRPESVAFELGRTFVTEVVVESGKIILLLNVDEIIKRKANQ